MNKKVLVVGGAGYIGSHTCIELASRGYEPVVFDNFSNGHREFVRWGPVEEGDVRDRARLDEVFAAHSPAAVLHFAGSIEVGESVRDPVSFYDNNVVGSLTLLAATLDAGVQHVVFSSTCATYGLPRSMSIDESHPQEPINPYGRTKWIVEQALSDYSMYRGLKAVMLRYFNAAGADPEGRIGEWHMTETHVIPVAIDAALGRREGFKVFGTDYDTRDGTCVRDYIHVMDLADAHVRALDYLLKGGETVALNLGTGTGTTVKELLDAISEISGRSFPVDYTGRREGDSTVLVANSERARSVLGWEPRFSLEEIIRTAWKWHSGRNQ